VTIKAFLLSAAKAINMNIGNVEILLNNPYVVIGVTADLEGSEVQADGGERPVTATMVKARVQSGAVCIRLWLDVGPAAGVCVFDGVMSFPAGVVHVSDTESVSEFSVSTGRNREDCHRLCIYVDDIDAASRVDVLIDADGPVSQLTAVPGYELTPVRGVKQGGLPPANELGLILDGYDRPFSRLAAAVKLVIAARDLLPPERAQAVNRHRALRIGEWMRGLGGPTSEADALRMAALLEERLVNGMVGDVDGFALDVAAGLLRVAGLQVLSYDPGTGDDDAGL
jgi:hypothetical protein